MLIALRALQKRNIIKIKGSILVLNVVSIKFINVKRANDDEKTKKSVKSASGDDMKNI